MKYLGMTLGVVLALASQLAMAAAHDNSPVSVTTVSAEELAAIKTDLAGLLQRVNQLEAENARLRQGQQQNQEAVVQIRGSQADTKAGSWTDSISLKGDFRYRYQYDDVDLPGVNSRNRQRIRARPAITAQLPGDVKVGFGLATGSDDPVSSNQTLGDGGSSKNINLDLAYFSWGTPIEGLSLEGGKFKNAFVRAGDNGLLWDSDWRPEGFQVLYGRGMFFAKGLGTWIDSDSSSGSGDEFAWGVQAGINTELGPTKITAGASYFDIGVGGNTCLFDVDDCFGNTAVPDPANPGEFLYANDFKLIEGFVELDFDAFGLPSQAFVDYVVNDDANNQDTGYSVGLRLNKAKKKGTWEASYVYEDLEANAVLGLLTDSDFAGGGTDSKGSKLGAAYALTDATTVKLTYFITEREDSNGVENGGQNFDWDTLQLDFEFKYK